MKKINEIYDGFEGDSLSDIWSHAKLEESAVKIQSEIVRKGKKAVKITINKGDKAEYGHGKYKDSERDELLERKELGPIEGKVYNYEFSIYLPKDFPTVPVRLVLAQWKQSDENHNATVDNPILALRYVGGELFIPLQTATPDKRVRLFETNEEIRGRWLDFKFEVKFTRTKEGFVKVWMNKKKIIDFKGITAYSEKYNYPESSRFYFKMGLYRDTMNEPMTAYFDEFKKYQLDSD